jgi:hypothetical protein
MRMQLLSTVCSGEWLQLDLPYKITLDYIIIQPRKSHRVGDMNQKRDLELVTYGGVMTG